MDPINEFLASLRSQRPTEWEQLPDFSLYMDQVLSYMDRQVLRFEDDDALTASMVNNYTKSGLVPRAEGKKYGREHLAYLTAICILKRVMSARDMDFLIREELSGDLSVQEGYAAFREGLCNVLSTVAQGAQERLEERTLADTAIHFALLSYASRMVCGRYVALLREQKAAQAQPTGKKGKESEEHA